MGRESDPGFEVWSFPTPLTEHLLKLGDLIPRLRWFLELTSQLIFLPLKENRGGRKAISPLPPLSFPPLFKEILAWWLRHRWISSHTGIEVWLPLASLLLHGGEMLIFTQCWCVWVSVLLPLPISRAPKWWYQWMKLALRKENSAAYLVRALTPQPDLFLLSYFWGLFFWSSFLLKWNPVQY